MSLVELKQYMMRVKVSNVFNISAHFGVSPEIVRDRLSHWIRKGRVRCTTKTTKCGTQCAKCSPYLREVYEWV